MGPSALPGGSSGGELYGPTAPPPAPPKPASGKIIVSFGPGFARGFAASGVLKKLSDLDIPISRIYAHETSALVSAVHAVTPNANRAEWAFLKFNDAPLSRARSLISLSGPESKVMDRMEQIFGTKRLSALRPPVNVAEYVSGSLRFVSDGEIRQVLRRALGGSELGLKPVSVDGKEVLGRGANLIDYIREIDSRESDPLVFVAFSKLTSDEESMLAQIGALKVQIDLHDIGEEDFKKRKLAAFRGQDAIARAKSRIDQLIGRQGDAESASTGF